MLLNNSNVSGNMTGSSGDGGGIATNIGDVTLIGSNVTNNTTGISLGDGGGISTSSGDVMLINSSVSNNVTTGTSGEGGGIRTSTGNVTLNGSSVANNTTGSFAQGGGIFTNSGDVLLTDSSVAGNSTGDVASGGGIFANTGNVTLIDSTVANNLTGEDADGGGIFVTDGSVTLTDSTIANNSTGGNSDGGGIFTRNGDVTLTDSSVSENSTGVGGDGGGIHTSDGDVTVTRSAINSNVSREDGGGIETFSGNVLVFNSTISGNQAFGAGGGINASSADLLHLVNSTVTNNVSGDDGGGIHGTTSFSDEIIIENSIVAENIAPGGIGADLDFGRFVNSSVTFSLIGSNSGTPLSATGSATPDVNGNLIGVTGGLINPLLSELSDHGGPTLTHSPLAGSPALNAGGPASIEIGDTDQRGATRVLNGRIDIGAVEGIFFGPQVADVILSSSTFSPNFIDAIDGDGIGAGNGLGLSLVGDQQLSVPWQNIDTLHLQFLSDVSASLDNGDILLTGTNVSNYSLGLISFDTDSLIATVPILGGIGNDRLFVSIGLGTVTDADGASVVGNNGEPFSFSFNVLPGDEDGNGQVNLQDASNVFASNTDRTTPENAWRDIDGSGQINSIDAFASAANDGDSLPAPLTAAPTSPATKTIAPTAAIDAAFSEVPLREEPVEFDAFAKTDSSVDRLQTVLPTNVENITHEPVLVSDQDFSNEPALLVSEPTQAIVLPRSLVNQLTGASSTVDRSVEDFSNELDRLELSPEFSIAGHVDFQEYRETQRDYFSVSTETTDGIELGRSRQSFPNGRSLRLATRRDTLGSSTLMESSDGS